MEWKCRCRRHRRVARRHRRSVVVAVQTTYSVGSLVCEVKVLTFLPRGWLWACLYFDTECARML